MPAKTARQSQTLFDCPRTVGLFVAVHVSNVASPNFSTTKKMRLCYRVAGYRFGCGSMCNYIVLGNGSQSRGEKAPICAFHAKAVERKELN